MKYEMFDQIEYLRRAKICAYCGKHITRWDLFRGLFWKLPLRINEVSQLWEVCCSDRCYGRLLARELGKLLAKDIKRENTSIPDKH